MVRAQLFNDDDALRNGPPLAALLSLFLCYDADTKRYTPRRGYSGVRSYGECRYLSVSWLVSASRSLKSFASTDGDRGLM